MQTFPGLEEAEEEDTTELGLWKRDLVISSLQPEDAGLYQCIVENGVGEPATAAARLAFLAGDEARPAPANLSAVAEGSGTVALAWAAPPGRSESLYILHYFESDGGRENTQSVDCPRPACVFRCCPNFQLKPFTDYTFYVSALASNGSFSAPSHHVEARTFDGPPAAAAPLQVQLADGPLGPEVHLSWELPPPHLLPGLLQGWLVQVHTADDEPLRDFHLPSPLREYTQGDLIPGRSYKFRIIPKTRVELPPPARLLGPAFAWTTVHVPAAEATGQRRPPAPQLSLRVLNSTALSIRLRPDPLSPPLHSFALRLLSRDSRLLRSFTLGPDERSLVIAALEPGREYVVEARAVSKAGLRGLETTELVRTSEAEPSAAPAGPADLSPPLHLWCEADEGGVRVRWLPAAATRYVITYTRPALPSLSHQQIHMYDSPLSVSLFGE